VIAGLISLLAYDRISDNLKPFLALFMAFYWLYNMVDAYRKSTFYNQALAGLGPLEIGRRSTPGMRGSLLVARFDIVGGVALGYTRFGCRSNGLNAVAAALILMALISLPVDRSQEEKQNEQKQDAG